MSTDLVQVVDLFESHNPSRVDRAKGVIRGVKVLGWKSYNGNEYDPVGIDPGVYEGCVVNVDHPEGSKPGSAYDRLGRLTRPVKRHDGIYADFEVLKSHRLAAAVFEAAERMPGVFGLSHRVAAGDYQGRKGPGRGMRVESVQRVKSVDLVGDPATVSGLFENRGNTAMRFRDFVAKVRRHRPRAAKALQEMVEAGIMSPQDTSAPFADNKDGTDDAVCEAFVSAVSAVVRDGELTFDACMKKLRAIMQAKYKLSDSMGGGTARDDDATESRRDGGTRELMELRSSYSPLLEWTAEERRQRVAALRAGTTQEGKSDDSDLIPNWTPEERKQRLAALRRGY